jgi:hypothetical protein
MKPLTATPELAVIAARIIWFEEPGQALADPVRFLSYAMRYGTAADIVALGSAGIGLDDYREALERAPAGIFDRRSWTYWHLKCGYPAVPPLPERSFA